MKRSPLLESSRYFNSYLLWITCDKPLNWYRPRVCAGLATYFVVLKIWDPIGVVSLYLYIMSPCHKPTASIHSWWAISEWLQPLWCWGRLDQQWARGWSSHLLHACGAVSQRQIGFALPWDTVVGTFDSNHSLPGPSSPLVLRHAPHGEWWCS